jgi:DNA end-binding protein Ku
MVAAPQEIELHQLHVACGQRIRLQRYCPSHGPVEGVEVVKGYEHAPGQYVVLDPPDLEQLRPAADKAVSLEHFLEAGQIDPALFAGRSFHLVPDGAAAQRPYAVLAEALRRRRKWAVGRAALSGRRHPVVVRRAGPSLALDVLHDPTRLQGGGKANSAAVSVAREEVALAGLLLDAAAGEVPWSDYREDAAARFAAFIEARLQGRNLPTPPPEDVTVLPLLDALKQSLGAVSGPKPRPRPARRRARKEASPGLACPAACSSPLP